MKSLARYRELWGLVLFLVVAFAFAIAMILEGDFLANVGFLVIGAIIAIVAVLIADAVKRPAQARDLARALHAELSDRVARCCFDCEHPWHAYLDSDNYRPGEMDSVRLRKFSPVPPVIYPSTASQIAILRGNAPEALIQFYYRLAAWERDISSIAAESQDNTGGVAPKAVHLLAIRVHQTLAPGLRALQALSPLVDGPEGMENLAIAGYDEGAEHAQRHRPLRERIMALTGPGLQRAA